MSRYHYSDDYDPIDHYYDDPVDFAMHGYGGFVYDTDHVKPDDATPHIVVAAGNGRLEQVRSLIETSSNPKLVLNASRRWTEVDYRMSGFTKEYEWHGATPLIEAARKGHADIVQYLLMKEADPTLEGCIAENVHYNAFSAAEKNIPPNQDSATPEKWMASYPDIVNDESLCPRDAAKRLFQVGDNGRRQCVRLLQAARPFWQKSPHASSRYDSSNIKARCFNKPTNSNDLLVALQAVPSMPEPSHETLLRLAATIESHRASQKVKQEK
jgi:Ankyrin repeats (3 copies)